MIGSMAYDKNKLDKKERKKQRQERDKRRKPQKKNWWLYEEKTDT